MKKKSTSLNQQSLWTIFPQIVKRIFLSNEVTIEDIITTSLVLVSSLTIFIPSLVLGVNIPLLVLVPTVGLSYGLFYIIPIVFSRVS
jgi:hypothetical protein